MGEKRGRPPMKGCGVWRAAGMVGRRVRTHLGQRNRDDPQSITDAVYRVRAFATRIIAKSQLTPERLRFLDAKSVSAKPSEVIRLLLTWRYRLPDRTVRRLQASTDIAEIRWA